MNRYIIIAIVAVSAIVCGIIAAQEYQYRQLAAENKELRTDLIIARQDITQCRGAIEAQNAKIAAYTFDKEESEKRYAANLAELGNKAAQGRVAIVKELVRDPSCENELRLIKNELAGFYE